MIFILSLFLLLCALAVFFLVSKKFPYRYLTSRKTILITGSLLFVPVIIVIIVVSPFITFLISPATFHSNIVPFLRFINNIYVPFLALAFVVLLVAGFVQLLRKLPSAYFFWWALLTGVLFIVQYIGLGFWNPGFQGF